MKSYVFFFSFLLSLSYSSYVIAQAKVYSMSHLFRIKQHNKQDEHITKKPEVRDNDKIRESIFFRNNSF